MQQGLLSSGQGAPAPAPQAPQQPPMPGQPDAQGAPDLDQEMFDTVVGQSGVWIYGEGLPEIKEQLQAVDDPADAIGNIVGQLLAANVKSAGEQGRMIPEEIIVMGSMKMIEMVIEVAVAEGLLAEEDAEREAAESFYEAMGVFGKAAAGDLDGESKQKYSQMIQNALRAEEEYNRSQQGSPEQAPQEQQPPMPPEQASAGTQPMGV